MRTAHSGGRDHRAFAWIRTGGKHGGFRRLCALAFLAGTWVAAQEEMAQPLAERSTIVLRGKVQRIKASDEPLLAASGQTVVVTVQQMYAGREITGDQTGRTATVVLSRPESLKAGQEALFFGNPRFVGRSVTIVDEGEIPWSGDSKILAPVERGVQTRKDRPVLERLAQASMVFRGSVESVRPLDTGVEEKKGPRGPGSEHDPDWQVAMVRVASPMHGAEAGQLVPVVFPGSRDILWAGAPKLKPSQEAVFLAHPPAAEARVSGFRTFLEQQRAYLVLEPLDVQPVAEEGRVRNLVSSVKEAK